MLPTTAARAVPGSGPPTTESGCSMLWRCVTTALLLSILGCTEHFGLSLDDDWTPGDPYNRGDGVAYTEQTGTIAQMGCVQVLSAHEDLPHGPFAGYLLLRIDGGATEQHIRSVGLESQFEAGQLPTFGQEVDLSTEACATNSWCLDYILQEGTLHEIDAGVLHVDLNRETGWLHAEFTGVSHSEVPEREISGYLEGTLNQRCRFCSSDECAEFADMSIDTWPPTESIGCATLYEMLPD